MDLVRELEHIIQILDRKSEVSMGSDGSSKQPRVCFSALRAQVQMEVEGSEDKHWRKVQRFFILDRSVRHFLRVPVFFLQFSR